MNNAKTFLTFFVIALFLPSILFAQNETIIQEKDASCGPSQYGFELILNPLTDDIQNYSHNDKAYICDSALPILLKMRDTETGLVPEGNSFVWSGINDHTYGTQHEARLTVADFNNHRADVKYNFIDIENKEQEIKLRIYIAQEFEIDKVKTNNTAMLGYDENDVMAYPEYIDGLPYKLLNVNGMDKVIFKNGSPKSLKSIQLEDEPFGNILTFTKNQRELELLPTNAIPSSTMTIRVDACETEELFRVDIHQPKTIDIQIITLCESDDDIANYCIDKNDNETPWENGDVDGSLMPDCMTPISSASHECILPGMDGTLDKYTQVGKLKFWRTKDNDPSRPKDNLLFTPYIFNDLKIRPSHTPEDPLPYFCNKQPLSRSPNVAECPNLSSSQQQSITNHLKKIYGQGNLIVNVIFSKVNANFDLESTEDNKLSTIEQRYYHLWQVGGTGLETEQLQVSENTLVWLVHNLTESVGSLTKGRATDFGLNTCSIDYSEMNDRTISHEIGHARFGFGHPDDSGYNEDDLTVPYNNDKFNFMNSGPLDQINSTDINGYIYRRYQWQKALSN